MYPTHLDVHHFLASYSEKMATAALGRHEPAPKYERENTIKPVLLMGYCFFFSGHTAMHTPLKMPTNAARYQSSSWVLLRK